MGKFKAPNLAVIDEAIWFVEHGVTTFSCVALWQAAREVDKAGSRREAHYTKQYEKFVFRRRGQYNPPFWWNYPAHSRRSDRARICRIQALRGFKQACIDAAKKG